MISDQKIKHTNADQMPLYPSSSVLEWGTTLVIASHPHDETLACGGAIALLRQMGYRVRILVISDGMTSSPSAPSHTDRQHHALQSLGLSEDTITRLGMNASLVPGSKEPGFEELVRLCRNHMNAFMPDTVLMPWRRAAHKDHRAVWQVVRQALKDELMSVRELEYSLMNWEQGQDYMLLPKTDETQAWRLDTSPVVDKKRQAISGSRFSFSNSTAGAEAHHYRMVQDPSADKLHSWEIYLEPACSLQ